MTRLAIGSGLLIAAAAITAAYGQNGNRSGFGGILAAGGSPWVNKANVSGLTCPGVSSTTTQSASRIGVFRPNTSGSLTQYSFIEDTLGLNMYVAGSSRFMQNFFPPSGLVQP